MMLKLSLGRNYGFCTDGVTNLVLYGQSIAAILWYLTTTLSLKLGKCYSTTHLKECGGLLKLATFN